MKIVYTFLLLACITACSHPLEIVGQGDISSSTGANNCALEEQPCANYVAGDYNVIYTPVPRAGWVFSGWENCGAQFPQCSFSVPGTTVNEYWGQVGPPLRALFTQDPSFPAIQTATSWSAVAETLTIDVTFSTITPTAVRLYPQGLDGGWVELDTAPPFSFSIDATAFEPGDHDMLVTADDGAIYLSETEVITVSGCNGDHDLCARRFDQVRYATTHNAMSNAANGWLGPNQDLDVPAQLAAGVRGLMLDTYSAGYINQFGQIQVPEADPDAAFLCHSVCSLGKQDLAEGLIEIREFLDGNPGAVVTLIIESYLNHELTAAAFGAANLTPYAYQHTAVDWPTLGQMIDAGTRLVVLQDVAVNPSYPWLMNVWQQAFETHFSAAVPGDFSCADNRGSPSSDLFIFNHFLTNVFGSPALAAQVNHNPLLVDRINECEAVYATPANFVTVDFVDIGDTLSTVEALNALGAF
ncbi:MAG: hypothetical protein ACI9NT_000746 [Bacteroidia bacterium]|jgi:hypothetical protein